MEITLKESLLFFAGLFVVMFILDKLFGNIPASYSVWIFGVGYMLGIDSGFRDGKNSARGKFQEDIEQQIRYKQHTKLMKKMYGKTKNNSEITISGKKLDKKEYPTLSTYQSKQIWEAVKKLQEKHPDMTEQMCLLNLEMDLAQIDQEATGS